MIEEPRVAYAKLSARMGQCSCIALNAGFIITYFLVVIFLNNLNIFYNPARLSVCRENLGTRALRRTRKSF